MNTVYRAKIFTFKSAASVAGLTGMDTNNLFVDSDQFIFLRDGAMVVDDKGIIVKVDDFHKVKDELSDQDTIVDYSDKLIMPGFIDSHMHTVQTSAVGAYGEKLLEWLENYVFPGEVAFNSETSASKEFGLLLGQLFKNGTTTICGYAPCAYDGADLVFEMCDKFNMRAVLGNTIMTEGHKDLIATPEKSMMI